jgi:processive 1,2-diacylglycerol beta-glucosyltransferase
VLSASVGAGHLRAAQAVELALQELAPEARVRNIDVLTLTNPGFRRVYAQLYVDLVNRAPHVLGYFYDLLDRPTKRKDRLLRAVQKLNLRPFLKLVRDEPWDVFVNTHFLPASLIASLKRRGKLRAPQFIVTTDFDTHRLWVNPPCEKYFTATEEGARYLASFGVSRESIEVTGIPIHPRFSRLASREACLASQGLAGDRPIVLQMAGGFGMGPVRKIFGSLLDVERPLTVVVVAGRNERLKKELEMAPVPPRHRVNVLGFTDKMHELLVAADVVLSKPGGLTVSEALATGAALAIVNPTPGQEFRCSDFLLENGAAVKINNLATLPFKIEQLLDDAKRLTEIRKNARALGKPEAAFEVARRALSA